MAVNSCFEDLEGRVVVQRVWEFVPEAGQCMECMESDESSL